MLHRSRAKRSSFDHAQTARTGFHPELIETDPRHCELAGASTPSLLIVAANMPLNPMKQGNCASHGEIC
jgi:hypothetical protein